MAIYKATTCFLDYFSLVYCMGTKESQRHLQGEVCDEVFDFIENACMHLVGHDPHYVINIDLDTHCVTVPATITASGDQLLPMVILKGSPTGTISRKEIPMFNPTSVFDLQKCVDG